MTTPLVQSISDEQLADLEAFCATPMFKDDANSPQTMGELRGLIARLRAAEADAKRYRHIRVNGIPDSAIAIQDSYYGVLEIVSPTRLDAAIDAELQGEQP